MPNIYDKPVLLDFKSTYISPNFAAIAQAAQAMDARGAQAEEMQWQMENDMYKVKALQEDTAERDAKIAEYDQAIEGALERAGGDYTRMAPFIKEQRRKLQRDLMMGDFAKMQKNYTAYQQWVQDHEERVSEGDVHSKEFQMARALALNNYMGYEFGDISLDTLVNQNNYGEIAMDIASKMKAKTTSTPGQWIQHDGGDMNALPPIVWEKLNKKVTELSDKEIMEVVQAYISTNPVYQDHINQRTDLEVRYKDMLLERNKSNWIEEKGGFSDEDIKLMEESGLDPYKPADQEEYLKTIFREDIKKNMIEYPARIAAEAFDVYDVEIDSKLWENPLALEAMKNQMAMSGGAFASGTPAELVNMDYEEIAQGIEENKAQAEVYNQNFTTGLKENGVEVPVDETLGQESRSTMNKFLGLWTENPPEDKEFTEAQLTMMEQVINKQPHLKTLYEDNPAAARREAERILENLANTAQQFELYNRMSEEEQYGLQILQEEVIAKNEDHLKNLHRNYRILDGTEGYDSLMETLKGIHSDKEFDAIFGPNIMLEHKEMGKMRTMKDRRNTVYGMWKTIQGETKEALEEGYAQKYTQLDLVAVKGIGSEQMKEYIQAKKVFTRPGQQVLVHGVETTVADAFGVSSVKDLENITPNVIFDKPGFYTVRASVPAGKEGNKTVYKDAVITAQLPDDDRVGVTSDFMKMLTDHQNANVSEGAKMYLGSQLIEDYRPSKYALLKVGETKPLRWNDGAGTMIGHVKKQKDGSLIVVQVDKNNPTKHYPVLGFGAYAHIGALVADIYEKYQVEMAIEMQKERAKAQEEQSAEAE